MRDDKMDFFMCSCPGRRSIVTISHLPSSTRNRKKCMSCIYSVNIWLVKNDSRRLDVHRLSRGGGHEAVTSNARRPFSFFFAEQSYLLLSFIHILTKFRRTYSNNQCRHAKQLDTVCIVLSLMLI
jgi:hypothetical protein